MSCKLLQSCAQFRNAWKLLRAPTVLNQTRDAFPAAKILKEGFQKVSNVWTKSHLRWDGGRWDDVLLGREQTGGGGVLVGTLGKMK